MCSIKLDPDAPSLSMIIQNEALLNEYRAQTTLNDENEISSAMTNYIILAIDWINSLFMLANVCTTEDKVHFL